MACIPRIIDNARRTFQRPLRLSPLLKSHTKGASTSRMLVWDSSTAHFVTTTGADGATSLLRTQDQIRSTTVLSTGTLWAEPVTVYWQSEDLSRFPSDYATSLAAAIGFSLNAQTSAPPTSGLSKGATAGIVVGAVLGAALVGRIIILVFLRRRKQSKYHGPTIPEMSGQSTGFKKFFRGRWRAEADGTSNPVEIDSRNVFVIPGSPVELDASTQAR